MARVLVIDDENNIRLMVRIALQASGHEVATASSGAEGLEKFSAGSDWDVVLLDQRMPGMDGLQVLTEIRRRQPAARAIMITAFGTIDLAAAAMRRGAVNFLRKPFSVEALRGAVASALEGEIVSTLATAKQTPCLSSACINGFRITSLNSLSAGKDGSICHSFMLRNAEGNSEPCYVVLPCYLTELVKAHADRERIPDAEHFWLWLCEEALANYLWQNAGPPPGGKLQVDELTTNLRRWIDAVLT